MSNSVQRTIFNFAVLGSVWFGSRNVKREKRGILAG
jgi:hypothetical protein